MKILGRNKMENIKLNNQYIFTLEKEGRKLFYNNINGKLAIAEKIQDLETVLN